MAWPSHGGQTSVFRVDVFADGSDFPGFTRLKGVGPRTAAQLLHAIERSKRAELWRFIYGLSILR